MIINTVEALKSIKLGDIVGYDIETSGLDPRTSEFLLLSLTDHNNTYVIDFTKISLSAFKYLDLRDKLLIGHNLAFDIKFTYYHTGVLLTRASDIMLNERMLSAGKFVPYAGKASPFSLAAITQRRLGITLDKDIREEFIHYNGTLSDQAYEYAAQDTKVLHALYEQQLQEIDEHNLWRVYELECALIPVTAKLELAGFTLDKAALQKLEAPFLRYIRTCEQALQDLFIANGGANRIIWDSTYSCINVSSKDQVKETLNNVGVDVESLNAKVLAKWDLRKNKDTLEILLNMLDEDQDIAEAVDKYGGYNNPYLRVYAFYVGAEKLYGTYIKGLQDKCVDGKIYPKFNQLGARSTGRYSSDAQQYPKDDKLQRLGLPYSIRKCIIAPKDRKLVIADYSAIELVIIAERSGDKKLAYEHLQGDLHTLVTNQIMGTFWPIAKETTKAKAKDGIHKLLRDFSKTLSYGIAYGVTGKSLAAQAETKLAGTKLTLTEKQGDQAIEMWKKLFPEAGKYLDTTARKAVTLGYTESLYGRKRWFDLDYIATNKWARLAAMREGSNQEIQSTSADMTKLAMMYLDRTLDTRYAQLILTVHDELVVECDDEYVEETIERMKYCMEKAAKDILPMLGHTVIVKPEASQRYDK